MKIQRLRKEERGLAVVLLVALLALQTAMIVRYWPIFSHFIGNSWTQFIRNFRMSGFDPIAYSILTDWHVGYDLLRHPLLPYLLYPLHLLNHLLWQLTGANCAQIIMGVLLTASAFWALILHYRTLRFVVGAGRLPSMLLTALLLGFGMIAVATMVPDHFCFSMLLLLFTVYRAGTKMKSGTLFGMKETVLLLVVTAGVTLSNGIIVVMAVALTNGRRFLRPGFLLPAVVLPLVLLAGFAETVVALTAQDMDAIGSSVSSQFSYTAERASRLDILIENFFGESLQLHRKYILGDVLLKRPVIIRYTWPAQYVVEAVLLLLSAIGFWLGCSSPSSLARVPRFTWLLGGILVFNLLLHIVLGFGINEVHIMAAHWAFVLTLSMGFLFTAPPLRLPLPSVVNRRFLPISSGIFLFVIVVYLWIYHGYQLVHYLSWPLIT